MIFPKYAGYIQNVATEKKIPIVEWIPEYRRIGRVPRVLLDKEAFSQYTFENGDLYRLYFDRTYARRYNAERKRVTFIPRETDIVQTFVIISGFGHQTVGDKMGRKRTFAFLTVTEAKDNFDVMLIADAQRGNIAWKD